MSKAATAINDALYSLFTDTPSAILAMLWLSLVAVFSGQTCIVSCTLFSLPPFQILIIDFFLLLDKYEWGQVISRLILGSATIAVTAIDINASKHVLTTDFDLGGSGIWSLVTHSWVYVLVQI